MHTLRWGEERTSFLPRANRFVYADGFWYFQTREEGNFGPYTTQDEADRGLSSYLMELLEKNRIFTA